MIDSTATTSLFSQVPMILTVFDTFLNQVRIWDTRKGSTPLSLITAHNSKIYGIDWSRRSFSEIVSCSADEKIKFWDYNEPLQCRGEIATNAPVWRSRFTPFGNGLISMPQRKDNNLYLWSCENPGTPAYTFAGHTDTPTGYYFIIPEFVWRYPNGANIMIDPSPEFQLITWSRDKTLRMWPVTKQITKMVGHVVDPDIGDDIGNPEIVQTTISVDKLRGILRSASSSALPIEGSFYRSASFKIDVKNISMNHILPKTTEEEMIQVQVY
jgi:WD40 repeat protein